jgi:transposase
VVWVWDNLNIHLAPELASFAAENAAWLRVYRLPAYAPDLNPAEGIWSLLKRSTTNFAAANLDGLVRIVKRRLQKDPVPAPPDRRLPRRHRPENRAPVTICTTSSAWLP